MPYLACVDHAPSHVSRANWDDLECDNCISDTHNAAQQSPTGGGPVPHQRLDHSWPTSCCLPAKCDGRSGFHPEREGQTCSGHVRVSVCISIGTISYRDDLTLYIKNSEYINII